ncbi:endonuclease/exonuclease/phosphatase family protein [Pontibacterium sp.]|uniref:endonuclease/exonuclease/phosphatase family protein n=1 Tax=Pontibacterium sp. TaxID=2036026 RepID=UPI0035699152
MFRKLCYLIWIANGLLLLWGVSRYVLSDDVFFIRYGNYFAPFLALIALGLIGFNLYIKSYIWAVCTAIIYLPLFLLFGGSWGSAEAVVKKSDISVLSYSVRGNNRDIESIAGVIERNTADIIFLQEVHQLGELAALTSGIYGGSKVHSCMWKGFVLLSRYPVTEKSKPLCVIHHPDGDIHSYNVHLDKALIKLDGQKRNLDRVLQELSKLSGPKLVVGDFNATELTSSYKRMSEQFGNAHQEVGSGLGFTFPTSVRRFYPGFAVIRIDHIFYSDEFSAVSSAVIDDYGKADHYPIRASLRYRKE